MENNEIMELAAKLGDALKNDERLVRLEKARAAYENDPVLSKNISWVTEVFLSLLKAKGIDVRALKGEAVAQAKVADLRQRKLGGKQSICKAHLAQNGKRGCVCYVQAEIRVRHKPRLKGERKVPHVADQCVLCTAFCRHV